MTSTHKFSSQEFGLECWLLITLMYACGFAWHTSCSPIILIRLVCMCPQQKSQEQNMVLPHLFASIKGFSWQVAQTAWRVPYSNAKWWMCRSPFFAVSAYNVHALSRLLKPAIHSLLHIIFLLRNGTSHHRGSFTCTKCFSCRVAQTAFQVPYLNTKW